MADSKIPAKVVSELNRQINQELGAAHSYLALSIWCEEQNLKGFAAFFGKQATEEHEHARKIIAHLTDRRASPDLGAINAPKQKFRSLLEAARQAQEMERANTQGVYAVYEAGFPAKDDPAQVVMHWLLNERVEEDRWRQEWVERVESATCPGSLSDRDRHIERLLAPDKKKD